MRRTYPPPTYIYARRICVLYFFLMLVIAPISYVFGYCCVFVSSVYYVLNKVRLAGLYFLNAVSLIGRMCMLYKSIVVIIAL